MDRMTDDQFDQFLEREARSYHEPPPTPRDAMWARIDAERRTRRSSAPVIERRRWWIAAGALAATLLLGIAIGTVMDRRGAGPAGAPPKLAAGPAAPAAPAAAPPARVAPNAPVVAAVRGPAPAVGGASSVAFDAVAADHLGRAEALLTTFNTESAQGSIDPQIGAWAGDLLSTTRLLMDSPRARNPQTRKLLSDLEVVLAQIAQLKSQPDSEPDELEIIEHAVRRQNMMTRLREATPSGPMPLVTGS